MSMNQEACVAKLSQISPDYHNSAINCLSAYSNFISLAFITLYIVEIIAMKK